MSFYLFFPWPFVIYEGRRRTDVTTYCAVARQGVLRSPRGQKAVQEMLQISWEKMLRISQNVAQSLPQNFNVDFNICYNKFY